VLESLACGVFWEIALCGGENLKSQSTRRNAAEVAEDKSGTLSADNSFPNEQAHYNVGRWFAL
jgi:hypothetical protein